jgi:hypothetical protein
MKQAETLIHVLYTTCTYFIFLIYVYVKNTHVCIVLKKNISNFLKPVSAEVLLSLRSVSGCTLTDHVHNTTIRNALQLYALEEIMRGKKKRKRHNHILRMHYLR